jgi:hypothetical protein
MVVSRIMRLLAASVLMAILVVGCAGLSDTEQLWCQDNYGSVIHAAVGLGVSVPTLFSDMINEGTADPPFSAAGLPSKDWAKDSNAVRACKAAFSSR